jgi:hypothetical protein
MRMAASVMALSEEENIDCAKVIHNYGPNGLLCAWNLLSHRANLTAEQLRRFRSFVLCWHWGLSRKGDTKKFSKTKIAHSAAIVRSTTFPGSAATEHHRVTHVHPADL